MPRSFTHRHRAGSWVWLCLLLPVQGAAEPLIAAHRGSVSQAPENTLAAFRWAEVTGAHLIEADLRVTADGALVVIHDSRVNRTTDGRGRVDKLSLDVLRQFDAGQGQTIPTVDEVLAFVRTSRTSLLLDVKDSVRIDADRLVTAVEGHGLVDRVLIGSRSPALTRALKARQPKLRVLGMVPAPDAVPEFLALNVDGIRLWARWARQDPGLIDHVRAAGAEVWIMTGSLKGRALHSALSLADGVITNHPGTALSLR